MSANYTTQTWTDNNPSFPVSAARLGHIESGIAAVDLATLPTFNVTAAPYSAAGNGSTNDTTAVQAAINAANSAGGGIVFFPKGTYLCADLSVYSNTTLAGTGWASIIKHTAGTADNTYLLSVNKGTGGTTSVSGNQTNITVRDLQLLGTVATDAFLEHVYLFNVNAVSDLLVDHVLFKGFRGDGLYLGSSNNAGVERHNERVKVVNSTFDGVNKDNRNGISVIDCDDFQAVGCTFMNTTRSTMPGAIDFEPNPGSTFAILRNCRVIGCSFRSIGGNAGIITIEVSNTQASLTNGPAHNFLFAGNTMRTSTNSGVYLTQPQTPTASTARINAVIADNVMQDINSPFEFDGVSGVKFVNNVVSLAFSACQLGYSNKCMYVQVSGNDFISLGYGSGSAIAVMDCDQVRISRNLFDSIGLANGTDGRLLNFTIGSGASSTSDNVTFWDNTLVGTTATALTAKNASHTLTAADNSFLRNKTLALSVNTAHVAPDVITSTVTYDPPSLATGAAASTTVTVTGAAAGDYVVLNHSSVETAATAWSLTGYVSSANTVTAVLTNLTGGTVNLGSGTLRARVFKQ